MTSPKRYGGRPPPAARNTTASRSQRSPMAQGQSATPRTPATNPSASPPRSGPPSRRASPPENSDPRRIGLHPSGCPVGDADLLLTVIQLVGYGSSVMETSAESMLYRPGPAPGR